MSESKIEWTERTWNPIVGCSILTPGCTNCYAMKMASRLEVMGNVKHYAGTTKKMNGNAVWTGKLALAPNNILLEPLKRKKPTTYFVNSMGDLFHEDCPDEWIDKVFAVMAMCPQHTFQVLTKRAERMAKHLHREMVSVGWAKIAKAMQNAGYVPSTTLFQIEWPLPNVWLGVSTERQQEADERIPHLLATPAAVRFISAEPLLGPIDLMEVIPNPIIYNAVHGMERLLDWVIVGGESGHDARPMHPDWARLLRDQCAATGVHYFFKQWGEHVAIPLKDNSTINPRVFYLGGRGHPFHKIDGYALVRCGKKNAGRRLDGFLHNAMPKVTA